MGGWAFKGLIKKQSDKIVFRLHGIERLFQRTISHDNALYALANSEVIEDYPTVRR